jgi:hypothetical protein
MKRVIYACPIFIAAGFLLLGCAHVQVTKQSATDISNRFVEQQGYRLSDYHEPKVRGNGRSNWIFTYEPRVPLLETNRFHGIGWATNRLEVVVDPRTGIPTKVHIATPSELD